MDIDASSDVKAILATTTTVAFSVQFACPGEASDIPRSAGCHISAIFDGYPTGPKDEVDLAVASLFAAFLIVWFPVQDLIAGLLYSHAIGAAEYLAVARNLLTCLFAAAAFVQGRLPGRVRVSMSVYCSMILGYSFYGSSAGADPRVVFDSAGVLSLPVLAVLVGYYCHPDPRSLRRSCCLLVLMASISTAFGFWEVQHTWFWTDAVQLGRYSTEVKGILIGYDPGTGLPGNFFDYLYQRRAAGLLAAPLAEGSVTVTAAIIALAIGPSLSLGFVAGAAIAILCAIGTYQSGTRGAILMGLLALLGYATSSARSHHRRLAKLLLVLVIFSIAIGPLLTIASYTLNLQDGSALLHLAALASNFFNLGSVVLVGDGVGMHGGLASQLALRFNEGGEGAIFGIAYQLGLPGALVFLWYYFNLFLGLVKGIKLPGLPGEISCALCGLWLGALVTFPTSDHILTFSGMAGFWLLVGGTLRVIQSEVNDLPVAPYQQAA